MTAFTANFDLREAQRMTKDLRRFRTGQQIKRAEKAALRAVAGPIARNMRREIRRQDLIDKGYLVKGIISRLETNKAGQFELKIGPTKKKKNGEVPSRYFHLADKGTKPHYQPDAHRLIGGRILVRIPGGAVHPGSKRRGVLESMRSPTRQELNNRYRRAYARATDRELKQTLKQ